MARAQRQAAGVPRTRRHSHAQAAGGAPMPLDVEALAVALPGLTDAQLGAFVKLAARAWSRGAPIDQRATLELLRREGEPGDNDVARARLTETRARAVGPSFNKGPGIPARRAEVSEEKARALTSRGSARAWGALPGASPLEAIRVLAEEGITDVSSADPRLLTLLEQGLDLEGLRAIAHEAVKKRKADPFAWAVVAIRQRWNEAAQLQLQLPEPPLDPEAWQRSEPSVSARALALGLPTWEAFSSECMARGRPAIYDEYRRLVVAADRTRASSTETGGRKP
jgi:hypothetical protein